MKSSSAALPGTCGELVQGRLDGVLYLVLCPIDPWSVVEVRPSRKAGWTTPPSRPKTAAAVRATARYLGYSDLGGERWWMGSARDWCSENRHNTNLWEVYHDDAKRRHTIRLLLEWREGLVPGTPPGDAGGGQTPGIADYAL